MRWVRFGLCFDGAEAYKGVGQPDANETEGAEMKAEFHPGDLVVYRKQKISLCPPRGAKCVSPAPHGDHYSYLVDKFWTVVGVEPSEAILVRTRRGKELRILVDDPSLRPANWLERLLFRHRFPAFVPTFSISEAQEPATLRDVGGARPSTPQSAPSLAGHALDKLD